MYIGFMDSGIENIFLYSVYSFIVYSYMVYPQYIIIVLITCFGMENVIPKKPVSVFDDTTVITSLNILII